MRTLFDKFLRFLYALSYHINLLRISDIAIEDYIARHLNSSPKYKDPKRLGTHEFQMFSQTGADGIIAEIFRRVGRTNGVFVEIGVGNGLENNTAALLLQGWSGVWIDGSKKNARAIQKELKWFLDGKKLSLKTEFITRENIVEHFDQSAVPRDLDLVSHRYRW